MRVALCQIPVSSHPEANLGRVRSALTSAREQGSDLAVFPEGTQVRFSADLRAAAEPLDGLFGALGQRESASVAPGSDLVLAQLGGLTVGLLTCYDIRFPELARALAIRGADLLVIGSAWAAGLFKEEHWVTLVRARAIENTIWIAAAGQVPDPGEPATSAPTGVGRSMLVDPMGTVRLDLGPAPAVCAGLVDPEETARVRSVLPCLGNRREDVFPGLSAGQAHPAAATP